MRLALRVLLSALLLGTLGALSGCGTSPPARFFTLDAGAPPAVRSNGAAYSIAVGPVTVPELVDRPQFVLRSTPNRVEIVEQVRWAAPLKSEIPRVVADQLARLLDGARTGTFAERATGVPDYRVALDIQRFDTDLQEGVTIQASWSVRPREGAVFGGRSVISEPAGPGYDQLVAAHSRALDAVSRDIATAITAMRTAKP